MDPESFSYANAGGSWGAWLKFAGYDGITVRGKADKPTYLFINQGSVEIRDASFLWGKNTVETREMLKRELGKAVRVVATSPAGENAVSFATMLADDDTSASSGFGAVMGSKNLKAIAVAGNRRPTAANPARLKELTDYIYPLRKGTWEVYTPAIPGRTKPRACYGCISGCIREFYRASNGEDGKFFCQASDVYRRPALEYYGEWNDVIFHGTKLCDKFGLDTAVMQPLIIWLSRCYEEGILSEEETGIPLSKVGSYEFIEALVRKISLREGFGDILAQGTIKATELVGKDSRELLADSIATRAGEDKAYDPRLYITSGLLYATEVRRPIQQIHEISTRMLLWLEWVKESTNAFMSSRVLRNLAKEFWGSKIAVDFTTYDGTALAAKKIQDRTYVKESLILCDFLWPILWVRYSEDHIGDTSLESKILSAVTGKEVDEEGLNRMGERIFNLQRAIFTREGRVGRECENLLEVFYTTPLQKEHLNRHCLVPGKDGEPISRKGSVVERTEFEKIKSEYYGLRGWDLASGLQTREKLAELELKDIAKDLDERGFIR